MPQQHTQNKEIQQTIVGPQPATKTLQAKGTGEKDDKGDILKQRNHNRDKTEIIAEKRRRLATTSGHCEKATKS